MRLISDVVEAKLIENGFFEVVFKETESNLIRTYKYEAKTPHEASEIVAKIEFLRSMVL